MKDRRPLLIQLANLADAILTVHARRLGVEEANPIAESLFAWGEAPFIAIKVGLVAFAVAYLDRHLVGEHRIALSWVLAALSAVLVWHGIGLLLTP